MDMVKFQDDMKKHILKGAEALSKSVKGTLGPCGHHVIMESAYGNPLVSNDGVTIAKAMSCENRYEQLAIRLLVQAASKTNEEAGDGTTTSIILANEMLKHGYAYMEQGGMPSLFVQGMELASQAIIAYIREHSHKIDTYESIAHIARISAKSEAIGKLIADALAQVNDPRCVHSEKGNSYESKVRIQEGMEVTTTPLSPYFFPKDKQQLIVKQPYLLISNERIESMEQIEHILAFVMSMHRPLCILCEDMDSEVLATLILAHLQHKLQVVVLKAPSFGTYQSDILDDIALLCHGVVYVDDLAMDMQAMACAELGECQEIIVSKHRIQLFAKTHEAVVERISILKEQLLQTENAYDHKHIFQRIQRLSSKIAVLEVGGYTESEVEEKRMRVEDALQAVYAGMEEGVIPGGGLALVQAYRHLQPTLHNENKEVEAGIQCMFACCLSPFLQLMENSYLQSVEMLEQQFNKADGIGYDVVKQKWCNLENEGIVDPSKVVVNALQNACSIACLLIRCDVAMLHFENKR